MKRFFLLLILLSFPAISAISQEKGTGLYFGPIASYGVDMYSVSFNHKAVSYESWSVGAVALIDDRSGELGLTFNNAKRRDMDNTSMEYLDFYGVAIEPVMDFNTCSLVLKAGFFADYYLSNKIDGVEYSQALNRFQIGVPISMGVQGRKWSICGNIRIPIYSLYKKAYRVDGKSDEHVSLTISAYLCF